MTGPSFRFVLTIALAAAFSLIGCREAPFDVVLTGGTLYNGLGAPGEPADLAVRDGKFVRLAAAGELSGSKTRRLIDATGLVLAPGFIDTHSHAADGLTDPDRAGAIPLLLQGVTSVVLNPDGDGALDLDVQREKVMEARPGVHFGQLAAHGRIREEVLQMDDRPPTADELQRMESLVRTAMSQGALGLSSGPFYAPGSYSETSELVALARIVAEEGGGVYQSHIRDESTYSIGLLAAVQEVIDVAEQSGTRGIITHIKALGPQVWGASQQVIEAIEAARERGAKVFADQYPYEASATGLGAALVPRWAQEGGRDAFLTRLLDPQTRTRIRHEMEPNLERRGGPDRIRVRLYETEPDLAGKTLTDIAAARGQEPLDAALDLVESGYVGIVSFNMADEDIKAFARQTWTMTASDGGLPKWGVGVPHPRSFGTFPRKLRTFALDHQDLTLAQALKSMTSLPAEVFGLEGRGVIREGAVADLVVFDPETLNDRATFEAPFQLAAGVVVVLVEGQFAVDGGKPTGLRAGQALAPVRSDDRSSRD